METTMYVLGGVIAAVYLICGWDAWRNRDRYNTMDEWEDD